MWTSYSENYETGVILLPISLLFFVCVCLYAWYVYFEDNHQNNSFIKLLNQNANKIHGNLEHSFYSLGQFIASAPYAVLFAVIVVCIILIAGISTATMETNVNKLWVQEHSKLVTNLQDFSRTFGETRDELVVQASFPIGSSVTTRAALSALQNTLYNFSEVPVDLSDLNIPGVTSLTFHDVCYEANVPSLAFSQLFVPAAQAQTLEAILNNPNTTTVEILMETLWRIMAPWNTPAMDIFVTPCNELFDSKSLPKNCSQYTWYAEATLTMSYLYPTLPPTSPYYKGNVSELFLYYYSQLNDNYGPDVEMYNYLNDKVIPDVLPGAAAYVIENDPISNAQLNGLYDIIFADPTFISTYWRFPCIRFSALDCFQEGGFDYLYPPPPQTIVGNPLLQEVMATFRSLLSAGGLANPFETRPSYQNLTDDEIYKVLNTGNCSDFAGIAIPMPAVIGTDKSQFTDFTPVYKAFLNSYEMLNEEQLPSKLKHFLNIDVTSAQAEKIILAMETRLVDRLTQFAQANAAAAHPVTTGYFLQRSLNDVVSAAAHSSSGLVVGSYILMLFYAIFTVAKIPSMIKSRVTVALTSICLIALSIGAGMGLTCYIGIPFNPVTIEVVPLLGLGLGVHGMFVLWSYAPTDDIHAGSNEGTDAERAYIGRVLSKAGPSCLLTAICNMIAFFIASTMPIGLVVAFSIMMGFIITINFFVIIFACTALLVIDYRRQIACRRDVLCCLPPAMKEDNSSKSWSLMDGMNRFGGEVYGPLLSNPLVKTVVFAAFTGFFIYSIYGALYVSYGLPLSAVVVKGSYQQQFLQIYDTYFETVPGYLVAYDNDHSQTSFQHNMMTVQSELLKSGRVYTNVSFPQLSFYNGLQNKICIVHGLLMLSYPDTTDYTTLAPYIMPVNELPAICAAVQTQFEELGLPSHLLGVAFGSYPPNDHTYVIPQAWFDQYADKYVQTVGVSDEYELIFVNVSTTKATPSPPGCSPATCARHLTSSMQLFLIDNVGSTKSYVQMIKDLGNITSSTSSDFFVNSIAFTYWQQYVHIRTELITILVTVILSICGVFLLFMLDFASMAILMALMVMNICEVYGCLSLGGMTLNAVPFVNLIMSAGVSTEYFARIIYVFGLSNGSRNDRMVQSMREMFAPVLHGGISTFLGIVLLAASNYTYFRTYYFNMYCLMIIIGLANGLILLPVVLSCIGPNSMNIKRKNAREEGDINLVDLKYARPITDELANAGHGSSHDFGGKF